jgi:tetratricopeptide (TPR) repeat protein
MHSESSPQANGMKKNNPHKLIELAIAKQQEGEPESGLGACLQAIQMASASGEREAERRGFNVASNCCLLSCDYATAIEYGLKAAAIARELKRDDAMINALANVTAALTHIGQIEDAVQIALNVADQFEARPDCKEDIRILLTNAAGAHLLVHDYMESMRLSMKAIATDGAIRDESSARARLVDELNWLVAAISLDMPTTVDARMKQITAIVNAYPTKAHELRMRLANALYLNYTDSAVHESISMLESLIAETMGFSTIQFDCYEWLIQLCKQSHQFERANVHRGVLTERRNRQQRARLQRALGVTFENEEDKKHATVDPHSDWINTIVTTTARYPMQHLRNEATLPATTQRALEVLSTSVRILNDLTGKSIYRIGKLSSMLSACIGYSAKQSNALELSTRLYPIGVNAQQSQHLPHPAIDVAATIELGRSEHWNGRGDPLQLSGKDIPEVARIAAIAIEYDELTHQRTLPHTEAVRELRLEKGNEFDPELIAHFLPLIERLHLQHDVDLDAYLASDAPKRDTGRKALEELKDIVPGLTLLELT